MQAVGSWKAPLLPQVVDGLYLGRGWGKNSQVPFRAATRIRVSSLETQATYKYLAIGKVTRNQPAGSIS